MFAGLRLSRAAARLRATSLHPPADRCWFSAASTLPLGGHAPAVECGGAPQPRWLRGAAAATASSARSAWPLARLHSAAAAAALAPAAPRARGVHVGDSAASAQPSPPSEPPGPPPLPPTDRVVAVKAFYLAQRIDLVALARRYEAHPKSAQRDSLLVSLGGAQDVAFASGAPCVAVTGYGSVVYFDADPGQQAEFSAAASACAVKRLPLPYADELRVAVRPQLAGWSSLAADTLSLRALDVNNLRVVSTVLAQSAALSHFEAKVSAMLELFSSLNADMEAEGGKLRLPRERLFQLVAENNNILTDLIARVGLLSRSDAAWAAAQYHEVFSALRADFELDERFENLHFQLDLIGKQLHFNLDILQNKKSDSLEWIIIILISVEILVSLSELWLHLPGPK